MIFAFDPQSGLITVRAELTGPSGSGILRLDLDTGATTTLVNIAMLVAIGYDPALTTDRVQVTTGSGVEFAPRVELERLTALGLERFGLQALGHTLPPKQWSRWPARAGFFSRLVREHRLSLRTSAYRLSLMYVDSAAGRG